MHTLRRNSREHASGIGIAHEKQENGPLVKIKTHRLGLYILLIKRSLKGHVLNIFIQDLKRHEPETYPDKTIISLYLPGV